MTGDPKPTAGKVGTQITVPILVWGVDVRRRIYFIIPLHV
jgi:hypothetical protein